MIEAIFGLVGVLIGSGISWWQTYWTRKQNDDKNARYLAIRIVCVLDNYLQSCVDVVKDDGLSYGQRTSEGCLEPQVEAPGPPVFPEDIDWRSIDHELMYEILSFPTEVDAAERLIKGTLIFASPPDYKEWFTERKYHYCMFGLMAYKLSEELSTKYKIKKMKYNDWNPVEDLTYELDVVMKQRDQSIIEHRRFIDKVLNSK